MGTSSFSASKGISFEGGGPREDEERDRADNQDDPFYEGKENATKEVLSIKEWRLTTSRNAFAVMSGRDEKKLNTRGSDGQERDISFPSSR